MINDVFEIVLFCRLKLNANGFEFLPLQNLIRLFHQSPSLRSVSCRFLREYFLYLVLSAAAAPDASRAHHPNHQTTTEQRTTQTRATADLTFELSTECC